MSRIVPVEDKSVLADEVVWATEDADHGAMGPERSVETAVQTVGRFPGRARLRESDRFRLLATNIPHLAFRSMPDGTRTWNGPQWIDFTGLSLSESLGFGWLDAVHPDDRERTLTAWHEAEASGEYYVEHRVRRKADGEYRWHQTRARPISSTIADAGVDWVGTMTDIHDSRSLQDRQYVLMAELQHRTRNLIAVTQAIASQVLRSSASLEAFGAEFSSRLRTLARAQSLIAHVDHQDVDVRELIMDELKAHAGSCFETGKVHIDGPPATLPAAGAQAIELALHELVTNAAKYGVLSQSDGKLEVTWRIESDGHNRRFVLNWDESGVDMQVARGARRKGYGSELIEHALPNQFGAKTKLEFGPDGVRCAIAVLLQGSGAEASMVDAERQIAPSSPHFSF